jgi:hypothetical protein
MLSIKNINGKILYNIQSKQDIQSPQKQSIPLPKVKTKKQSYNDWYDKNQVYVDYIVDQYIQTLSQFQSNEYSITFNYNELIKYISYWVYISSTS